MTSSVYVEIEIRSPIERVWQLTQEPRQHSRWDARFTSITPVDGLPGGGYVFDYGLRIPFHTIRGSGTTIGEHQRADGTRTSALRFATSDRLSPLGNGRGFWRYLPTNSGVTFITGYQYEPGWGRLLDAIVLRRFTGWLTAWSFDRLRIWVEDGVDPERWPLWSVLKFWDAGRPRASRCRRQPRRGGVMDDQPDTLRRLVAP